MYKIFISALIGLAPVLSIAQKGVQGVFRYKAELSYADTNVTARSWDVLIFTNDTVVRTESPGTALGNQVYIRHMALGKAYLLLDYNGRKFAIQTDLEKQKDADSIANRYIIAKKLFGGKKVAGIKGKRYHITDTQNKIDFDAWFAKKIPGKYLEIFPEIRGLALDYVIASPEGPVHYYLAEFRETPVDRDVFGVPSDYKRVTFEEFINSYTAE
jgi:hypothetical protein